MMTYYKVLGENGSAYHGGSGCWPLPHDNEPGEWLSVTGDLVLCENGLHLCRPNDLIRWLGPTIYEAEADESDVIEADDKVVVRRARLLRRIDAWNERTARLFACECAEHVLPLYEQAAPGDDRPRQAIAVARRYADGAATDEELAAAWDAVWDAAWDAAWAEAAAGDAARAAARAAAWAAAWDAAGTAARAAAWAAARDAAWGAAGAAAWGAAWAAAGAAERAWQTERLLRLLGVSS